MPIEQTNYSFRTEIERITGNKKNTSYILEYNEAYEKIINDEIFKQKMTNDIEMKMQDKQNSKIAIKDKAYFRAKKKDYEEKITECINRNRIQVRNMTSKEVADRVTEDIYGFKVISDLYYSNHKNDKYGVVTDIYLLGYNKIYYECSKSEIPLKYDKSFESPKEYRDFIERLMREANKSMLDNGEYKVVDFDLYEDRYNAISKAVAPNDLVLTMRKHQEDHIKLSDILEQGGMSQEVADLYGLLILGECNTIMAGVTGSGKTTTMRAILDTYVAKANKRMLVCEDTRELFPENDHTLELQTSPGVDEKTSISLRDLIMLALRQKPKYIVVGEVRGPEAEAAVEAMSTGHSTHFTMHAGTPIDAINRLVTKYLMQMPSLGIDVVERIIGSAVDYIIIQDAIPGIGRRITSITECTYDYESKRVALKSIMKFDFKTKTFKMENKLSPEKADKMLRKGIQYEQLASLVEGWENIVS